MSVLELIAILEIIDVLIIFIIFNVYCYLFSIRGVNELDVEWTGICRFADKVQVRSGPICKALSWLQVNQLSITCLFVICMFADAVVKSCLSFHFFGWGVHWTTKWGHGHF